MAACDEGDEELARHFLHADDDPADFRLGLIAQAAHPLRQLADRRDGPVRSHRDAHACYSFLIASSKRSVPSANAAFTSSQVLANRVNSGTERRSPPTY